MARKAIWDRVTVDWETVPALRVDPHVISTEVEMKGLSLTVEGGFSLLGPGRTDEATLRAFREGKREQWLVFELAKEMTKRFAPRAEVPAHRLFLQLRAIVERFLREKVDVALLGDRKDLFLTPYFGWALERLLEAVRPDLSAGEAPELPVPEKHMPPGTTADVDFVSPQRQPHDYVPDFIVRLATADPRILIVETKGYDPLLEVKKAAAERWVRAVNADGSYGRWSYALATEPGTTASLLAEAARG
jgi:type III restriction enzyme